MWWWSEDSEFRCWSEAPVCVRRVATVNRTLTPPNACLNLLPAYLLWKTRLTLEFPTRKSSLLWSITGYYASSIVCRTKREPCHTSLKPWTCIPVGESNFFRIHLTVFTITPLICSGIFYAANGKTRVPVRIMWSSDIDHSSSSNTSILIACFLPTLQWR